MNNNFKKDAVGKGLKSLLQNIDADIKNNSTYISPTVIGVQRISLDKIIVNPHQPRKDFNESNLKELSDSIKLHDIIQPITVTKINNDNYQIISGERRYRASLLAGLKDIPVYVRQVNTKQNNVELALLENLQRTDLNAIEIAISYQQLVEECNITHEDLAQRMSKDRSTISNYLRLLKLPASIQIAVRNNSISMGHARCLIGLDGADLQTKIFNNIIEKNLSVRATEDLIKNLNNKENKSIETQKNIVENMSPIYKKIEDSFVSFFNSKVDLKHNETNKKGTITIHYFNNEELTEIMKKIGITLS